MTGPADTPMAVARQEIGRGERLVWADRAATRRPGWGSLGVSGFGLLFAAFAAFWMTAAYVFTAGEEGPWRFFPLFGLPFLVVGVAVATAPFWLRFVGFGTIYAATDRRVLAIVGGRRRAVRSAPISGIGDLDWTETGDGSGDIAFAGAGTSVDPGRPMRLTGFHGVANVRRVVRDLERLRDDAIRAERDEAARASPPPQ